MESLTAGVSVAGVIRIVTYDGKNHIFHHTLLIATICLCGLKMIVINVWNFWQTLGTR